VEARRQKQQAIACGLGKSSGCRDMHQTALIWERSRRSASPAADVLCAENDAAGLRAISVT